MSMLTNSNRPIIDRQTPTILLKKVHYEHLMFTLLPKVVSCGMSQPVPNRCVQVAI
jgi:hypothetical protein